MVVFHEQSKPGFVTQAEQLLIISSPPLTSKRFRLGQQEEPELGIVPHSGL